MKFHRTHLCTGLRLAGAILGGCKDRNAVKVYRVAKAETESPAPQAAAHDSSGMGALVGILRTMTHEGGDMRIAGLLPEVHTIFELTRLHRIFDIYDTVSAAITAG